jgi:hypothetical protein
MIDRSLPARTFLGYRPGYYALRQIAAVIGSYERVSRVDLNDVRRYMYRFDLRGGGQVIVAWADNGLWLPGDKVPLISVSLPVGWTGPVQAEWTVTEGSAPIRKDFTAQDGKLTIDLGPIPVFLTAKS